MLHVKFQSHRTLGSGEEDFFKIFTINGHLDNVTMTIFTKFITPFPMEAPHKIWP